MKQAILILMVSIIAGCKDRETVAVQNSDIYYTCSMDPQVVEYKPGKCPICHMELTAVNKSGLQNSGEIMLSAQQVQLGNIRTDTVRKNSIGNKLVLTATLTFNQMKAVSLSTRVTGRIEKLYYRNAGDYVHKGSPVYELYSEELNNAKQEYLLLLERQKTFDASLVNVDQLMQGARNKLLLWGMSESQVADLAASGKANPLTTFYASAEGFISALEVKEGDYLMEGGTVLKLADLSSLWAEAQVYTSQLASVDRNGNATVMLPDVPGKEMQGKIEFVNPEINAETRINLIRVSIPNPGNRLRPGMPAYVFLKSRQRNTLTLPVDAVIRDGMGATVWVKTGVHSFKSRMVTTGLETEDGIEIKSGLSEGDIVVVSGAYLLNSEYIFKKGSSPMQGHDMGSMK